MYASEFLGGNEPALPGFLETVAPPSAPSFSGKVVSYFFGQPVLVSKRILTAGRRVHSVNILGYHIEWRRIA